MKKYFERLYKYNTWANDIILKTLKENAIKDEEIIKIISHLISAQEIWISRITDRRPKVNGVWGTYSFDELQKLSDESGTDWLHFIDNITERDYRRLISYTNTQGVAYDTPVIDIMAHAVNHTSYHRAQIAKLLRQKGIAPPNTDFITYARAFALE